MGKVKMGRQIQQTPRKKELYKPLPYYLTIRASDIEGLGIFTTRPINNGELIGITHHANERAEDGWIRTPLG